MVTKNIEEYLETIYRLSEKGEKCNTTNIAKNLNLSPASVTEMLQKLAKEGYVKYTPYQGVILTKRGKIIGEKILRKHRILEKFLQTIGTPKHRIHAEACELEHVISDNTEKAIDHSMGHPEKSPTDKRIPRERRLVSKGRVIPLGDLREKQSGVISLIMGGRGATQRLLDMGLTPGTIIKVLKSAPFGGPIVILVRGSSLAIGHGLAMKIFVEEK